MTARCWRVIHSNRNELNVGNEPRKLRPTCSLSFWLAGVGAGKKLGTWTEAARRKPVFAAGMHRTSKPLLCSSQHRRRLLSSEFLWDFKNPCGPLDTVGSVGQYYENRWLFNRVWDTQTRNNRKPRQQNMSGKERLIVMITTEIFQIIHFIQVRLTYIMFLGRHCVYPNFVALICNPGNREMKILSSRAT